MDVEDLEKAIEAFAQGGDREGLVHAVQIFANSNPNVGYSSVLDRALEILNPSPEQMILIKCCEHKTTKFLSEIDSEIDRKHWKLLREYHDFCLGKYEDLTCVLHAISFIEASES